MRGEARGEVKGECCEDLMRKSVGRTARPGGGAGLAVALRGELATGVLLRDLSCHGAGELRRMTVWRMDGEAVEGGAEALR